MLKDFPRKWLEFGFRFQGSSEMRRTVHTSWVSKNNAGIWDSRKF